VEPIQITDEFKEILDEPWLERHLHIALQHTSPKMLKIMNRRNVFKQDKELFDFLADKGFSIGTDFITGHPGETDEIWDEAITNLKLLPLTHLHAFTYSKRDGTPSASMKPEINGKIAKARLHEIESIIEEKNYNFRKNNHLSLEVLIESQREDGLYQGFDQFFNKLLLKSDDDMLGNWINVDNYEINKGSNYAEL
jgi:tRNA A37 methylthiotransferase MiaB